MKTVAEIKAIVAECSYLDWDIRLRMDGDRPYVQVFGFGLDPHSGKDESWSGRKWMLSSHMCDNEIVRTCHKAIETAVLHEMNEHFKFKDFPIANPHLNFDILVDLAREGHDLFQVRKNIIHGAE